MMHRTRLPIILAAAFASAALPPAAGASAVPQVSSSPARTWQVPAPGWSHANKEAGRVDDVLPVGSRVYLGGNFVEMTNHSGAVQARSYLASVSASTGALRAFHPRLNGRVYALAASPDGRYLYVGGAFTRVNGVPREHVAAFVVSTGRLASRLPDVHVSGPVLALAATSSALYIGGGFTSVAGQSRGRLAKFVLSRSGRFTLSSWAPSASNQVRAIVVDPTRSWLIAGGLFTTVDGRSENRIAAIGQGLGRLKPWASHPTADILDLRVSSGRLYAAEAGPGGTALAYDLATGRLCWYYKTDGNVQAVTTVRGYPVFGMHGDYVAPKRNQPLVESGSSPRIQRHKLFMLTPGGVLEPWNPDVSSTAGVLGVWALRAANGSLYVGGDFTAVHGVGQQRFAILRGR
jgi:hypothetical protein